MPTVVNYASHHLRKWRSDAIPLRGSCLATRSVSKSWRAVTLVRLRCSIALTTKTTALVKHLTYPLCGNKGDTHYIELLSFLSCYRLGYGSSGGLVACTLCVLSVLDVMFFPQEGCTVTHTFDSTI